MFTSASLGYTSLPSDSGHVVDYARGQGVVYGAGPPGAQRLGIWLRNKRPEHSGERLSLQVLVARLRSAAYAPLARTEPRDTRQVTVRIHNLGPLAPGRAVLAEIRPHYAHFGP